MRRSGWEITATVSLQEETESLGGPVIGLNFILFILRLNTYINSTNTAAKNTIILGIAILLTFSVTPKVTKSMFYFECAFLDIYAQKRRVWKNKYQTYLRCEEEKE